MASLITTIGISNIIQNLLTVYFGSERKSFPAVFDFGSFKIGDITVTSKQICMCLVSLVLMAILVIIVQKTKVGLAMRATEQNSKAANMMGVNVNFVISFTFFIAGVSASIAGVLIGGYYEVVYPTMGFMAGLKAFAAAVLGGIGSLPGAIVGGLVILIFASNLLVNNAVSIAQELGVSEAVIGLTIVAAGTSMPELATSVVSALKKNPDIAIGNIVGSNLFNILAIAGTSSVVSPIAAKNVNYVDLLVMLGLTLLLLPLVKSGQKISRAEGWALILVYLCYLAWLLRDLI